MGWQVSFIGFTLQKAESNRLIPRKLRANLELPIVVDSDSVSNSPQLA